MVQKWDDATGGYAKPVAGTKIPDHMSKNTDGIDTAFTHCDGTTDPNDSWGTENQGALFHDRGLAALASTTNPLLAKWEDLDGASGFGWRYLCGRYFKFLAAAQAITFSPTGPFAASQTWTSLDLSTLLDGVGVQDNDAKLVTEVVLQVRVKSGASETLGQDNCYASFRRATTYPEQRVYASGVDRYENRTLIVDLTTAEAFEWSVTIGGGTASFSLTADVIGFMETW